MAVEQHRWSEGGQFNFGTGSVKSIATDYEPQPGAIRFTFSSDGTSQSFVGDLLYGALDIAQFPPENNVQLMLYKRLLFKIISSPRGTWSCWGYLDPKKLQGEEGMKFHLEQANHPDLDVLFEMRADEEGGLPTNPRLKTIVVPLYQVIKIISWLRPEDTTQEEWSQAVREAVQSAAEDPFNYDRFGTRKNYCCYIWKCGLL
jgi:hypothetical protein